MGKFFNVTVVPEIPASKQHAGAFAGGDLLFDWTSFEIPKGGARLIGATFLVRPKGNATPSPNEFGLNVCFATNDTQAAGTINSTAANEPTNSYIGVIEIDDANSYAGTIRSTSIASTGRASSDTMAMPGIVLCREDGFEGIGSNVGYDKFYMRGIARGAFDFTSINAIAEDTDAAHADSQVITMDGTGMDVREHFIAGDVLHIGTSVGTPAADSLIGTVASADSATQITLKAVSPTALVDGDILYNLNPIRIVLHLEK